MALSEVERYRRALGLAMDALAVYADPETYHAVAFAFDGPCGEFAEDFSKNHGHDYYDRPMPGKLARSELGKIMKRYPDLKIVTRRM